MAVIGLIAGCLECIVSGMFSLLHLQAGTHGEVGSCCGVLRWTRQLCHRLLVLWDDTNLALSNRLNRRYSESSISPRGSQLGHPSVNAQCHASVVEGPELLFRVLGSPNLRNYFAPKDHALVNFRFYSRNKALLDCFTKGLLVAPCSPTLERNVVPLSADRDTGV
ncbi:hypothetical protein BV22DRAFT_1048340 [Leucogyrophana mollusca]|uniref:Uncharacterized protein n=1 Tax=Leucogyrophana mollusca TaxID=85980 RepID=A0ACB8BC63_9AGAM|nr:hypothetical protein BV22DRAFT_1048340 [Leucogyrophana mollusca]